MAGLAGDAEPVLQSELNAAGGAFVMRGTMLKQGHKRKNWKKRFFVLVDSRLYYFRVAGDTQPCLGMIDLIGAHVETAKPPVRFGLEITTPSTDSKNLLVSCASESEKKSWAEAIVKQAGEGVGGFVSEDLTNSTCEVLQRDCARAGYLWKKGAKRRNWKQRFFVLRDSHLFYFKSDDAKETPIAAVSVLGASVASEESYGVRNFLFSVRRHPRSFLLEANDAKDVREWIVALGKSGCEVVASDDATTSSLADPDVAVMLSGKGPRPPSAKQGSAALRNRAAVKWKTAATSLDSVAPMRKVAQVSAAQASSSSAPPTEGSVSRYPSLSESVLSGRKVIRRIAQSMREDPSILSVVSENLVQLPVPEILSSLQYTLTNLCLSFNRLSYFPSELCECRSLSRLLIHNNKLRFLPSEIGRLANLTELYVNHNKISELPPQLGDLENLVELSVSSNELRELPTEIGKLSHLVLFFASSNQLSALPEEVCQLQLLEHLWVNNNRLLYLPGDLCKLKRLQELIFTENPVFQSVSPFLMELARKRDRAEARKKRSNSSKVADVPADAAAAAGSGSVSQPQRTWSVQLGEEGIPLGSVPDRIQKKTNDEILSFLKERVFKEMMVNLMDAQKPGDEAADDSSKAGQRKARKGFLLPRRVSSGPIAVPASRASRNGKLSPGRGSSRLGTLSDLARHPGGVDASGAPVVTNEAGGSSSAVDETEEEFLNRLVERIRQAKVDCVPSRQFVFVGQNRVKLAAQVAQSVAVPGEIGELSSAVDVLDLSSNHFFSLPPEIGQLTNATDLVLADNEVENLPEELGQLTSLATLVLSGNRLVTLPLETICALRSLHSLDVSRNRLETLWRMKTPEDAAGVEPEDEVVPVVSSLSSASGSVTTSNSVSGVRGDSSPTDRTAPGTEPPAETAMQDEGVEDDSQELDSTALYVMKRKSLFRNSAFNSSALSNRWTVNLTPDMLSRLKFPTASEPKLVGYSVLPSMGDLPAEGYSDFESENLHLEKAQVRQLRNLAVLNVSQNNLRYLPDSLGYLPAVSELDASRNHLVTLPRTIGTLGSTFRESEAAVEVKRTVEEYSALHQTASTAGFSPFDLHLLKLNLAHNNLVAIPHEIGYSKSLVVLDLRNNSLRSLPSSIGSLKSLRILLLASNALESVPVEIGYCSSLDHLDVSLNKIAVLPSCIGMLLDLCRLDCTSNYISAVPSELCRLESLEELLLASNRIRDLPPEFVRLGSSLKVLTLDGNRFVSIPPQLENLAKSGCSVDIVEWKDSDR